VGVSATLAELERLYLGRFQEYLRVATALTGSVESGREAVHDGFVNAVRSRSQFGGRGTLDGWVWKAVVNSALSRQRHDRLRPAQVLEDVPEPASNLLPDAEVLVDVRSAVSALPERQRVALFLRYYADLDYRSIADVTGVSEGTVGATLHAAHRALRECLKEVPVS
jgi:RNA polymerase sigma factor (sigma-70 family)